MLEHTRSTMISIEPVMRKRILPRFVFIFALAGILPTLRAADAVIGLIDSPAKAKAAQAAWAAKLKKPVVWSNSIGMKFQLIPPGEFVMGQEGDADAKPKKVGLTKPFYLGIYEVTRAQWEKVTKRKHSNFFPGDDQPMNYVDRDSAEVFAAALSKLEGITNAVYRLPTEAEWEYAARAGTT